MFTTSLGVMRMQQEQLTYLDVLPKNVVPTYIGRYMCFSKIKPMQSVITLPLLCIAIVLKALDVSRNAMVGGTYCLSQGQQIRDNRTISAQA